MGGHSGRDGGDGLTSLTPGTAAVPDRCATEWVRGEEGLLRSMHDIDGDGYSDLAEGVPAASTKGAAGSGAIDVHFGVVRTSGSVNQGQTRSPQRLDESTFDGQAAGTGDHFGASVATARVNNDYCADLAIGAPGADAGRGKVYVALGSAEGVRTDRVVTIEGRSPGEAFGSSVVSLGAHLWIGAPKRTVRGAAEAGAVDHYVIAGDTALYVDTFDQGGSAEKGDHVGAVLAIDSEGTLAVGAPDEDVAGKADAGIVAVVHTQDGDHQFSDHLWFTEATARVKDTPEAGAQFGASLSIASVPDSSGTSMVAVGVPGEDVGGKNDAGMVHVLFTSYTLLQDVAITQNTTGISGAAEAGDAFGAAVLVDGALWFGPDTDPFALAIGSPGEALGSVTDAGTVTTVQIHLQKGKATGVTQDYPAVYQGAPHEGNVGGTAERGDRFGSGVSAVVSTDVIEPDGWFDWGGCALAIAATGEDVNGIRDAGNVTMAGHPNRAGRLPHVSIRDSAGEASDERYGVGWSTSPTAGYSSS